MHGPLLSDENKSWHVPHWCRVRAQWELPLLLIVFWFTGDFGLTYRQVGYRGSFNCWILADVGKNSALSWWDLHGRCGNLHGVVHVRVWFRSQSWVRATFPRLFHSLLPQTLAQGALSQPQLMEPKTGPTVKL